MFKRNFSLSLDGYLLFITRIVRLFAYGFLSVILVIYLARIGLPQAQIGWLLTLTLIGDAVISLWLTVTADAQGRRRMLQLGAVLVILAGIVFGSTAFFPLLLLAAIIGVISPSGNEVGPFLAIEQSCLSQITPSERRTTIFAWYNLVGSFATAAGALSVGFLHKFLVQAKFDPLQSYRSLIFVYAFLGIVLFILFRKLSPAVEVFTKRDGDISGSSTKSIFGLHRSFKKIMKLAGLFAVDAFGGGFIIQSLVAYWFYIRFGLETHVLGGIFFGMNILAGCSALLAARLVSRFGLINTMVFTHIPSNIFLILVPFMPNFPLAIGMYLLRSSISQMDVPTRQSYTMAVVSPDERSAAAGVTNIARTLGASLAPLFVGLLFSNSQSLGMIFVLAGGIKIIYDIILYYNFQHRS